MNSKILAKKLRELADELDQHDATIYTSCNSCENGECIDPITDVYVEFVSDKFELYVD